MDKNTQRAIEEIVEKQRKKVEEILQAFQKDIITYQSKVNVLWNTMNVFIKVLTTKNIVSTDQLHALLTILVDRGVIQPVDAVEVMKKGGALVTQEDFVDAGGILIREARENVEKARQSAETGIAVKGEAFKKVPIEETTEWMQEVHAREKAHQGGGNQEPS